MMAKAPPNPKRSITQLRYARFADRSGRHGCPPVSTQAAESIWSISRTSHPKRFKPSKYWSNTQVWPPWRGFCATAPATTIVSRIERIQCVIQCLDWQLQPVPQAVRLKEAGHLLVVEAVLLLKRRPALVEQIRRLVEVQQPCAGD